MRNNSSRFLLRLHRKSSTITTLLAYMHFSLQTHTSSGHVKLQFCMPSPPQTHRHNCTISIYHSPAEPERCWLLTNKFSPASQWQWLNEIRQSGENISKTWRLHHRMEWINWLRMIVDTAAYSRHSALLILRWKKCAIWMLCKLLPNIAALSLLKCQPKHVFSFAHKQFEYFMWHFLHSWLWCGCHWMEWVSVWDREML